MRDKELQVYKHLAERGVSRRALRAVVDVAELRARVEREEGSAEEMAAAVAFEIASRRGVPIDPIGAAGAAAEIVGGAIGAVVPKRPEPIPRIDEGELSLRNCNLRLVGQVGEGDYLRIEVSDNGDTFFFDTPGRVEVITDPPLPSPPGDDGNANSIDGNGSLTLTGPRTVWLHLKDEEDACSVETAVFPIGRRAD